MSLSCMFTGRFAEAFRLIYPVHCGIFASLVAVLAFGLSDPTFNLISKVLMVPAVAETVLRIALHHHPRFRADTKLAQIVGSRAMLVALKTCLQKGPWRRSDCNLTEANCRRHRRIERHRLRSAMGQHALKTDPVISGVKLHTQYLTQLVDLRIDAAADGKLV